MKNLREQWLTRATNAMRVHFALSGVTVPTDVKLSCGFPGGGSVLKRIGECWPRSRSAAKVNEIFISPILADGYTVLDVLGHELLHAVDDCKSGHGRAFTKASKAVGYTGGKHSKADGAKAYLHSLLGQLGPYPHGAVNAQKNKRRSRAGLVKFECCEDVLYSTWLKIEAFGLPHCRCCGEPMQPVERGEKIIKQTI